MGLNTIFNKFTVNKIFGGLALDCTGCSIATHQVVSPELVTIWLSSRKRQQDK